MSYKFRGIDIASITYTTGGVTTAVGNTYKGFPPTVGTTYDMAKPLKLGYAINSVDVSNSCTASYIDIPNDTNISIPSNVKKFRYILIGGGGGGGGSGGDAKSNQGDGSGSSNGNGGNGGAGGYAQYSVNTLNVSNTNITITIGTGGPSGTNGNSNSTKGSVAGQPTNSTNGGDGKSSPGNDSTLTYNNIVYISVGGVGGPTGNGASAKAAWGNSASVPGTTNILTTPPYYIDSGITAGWQPLDTYGYGGIGAVNGISNSTAGNNGFCRIIWLYD